MENLPLPWEPRELRATLRRIVRRHGHGAWRCPDDLLDRAWDLIIDRVLRGNAPPEGPRLTAWADRICLNLARSDPSHQGLCRRRVHALASVPTPTTRERLPGRQPQPTEALDSIEALLRPRLTAAELRALDALGSSASMVEAARRADMTRRDLRIRLRRIAQKARGLSGEQSR